MKLHPLAGHGSARQQLARAMELERLPQMLLITGPAGVGKQRVGLWIAQRLLCEQPADDPCGQCMPCRQVLGLAHPDLHWFMPVLRPKASEPAKQVEEIAELLGEKLAERREDPLYGPPDGMAGHFVSTARLLSKRAQLRPSSGPVQVFLIGHADRLVPQEASPEAANALLKLMEEPPPGTYVVLTTDRLEEILPTIRSRAVRLRLGRLPDDEVRGFLEQSFPEASPARIQEMVRQAGGAIGQVVGNQDRKAESAAGRWLDALEHGEAALLEEALRQAPWSARGEFTSMLDDIALRLGDRMKERAGSGGHLRREFIALDRLAEAREAAQQNVNPQLLLAVLGTQMSEES